MNRERYRRLESLFDAAIELTSSERPAFLARECASDTGLRKELEILLTIAPTLASSGMAATLPAPDPDARDVEHRAREIATIPMRGEGLRFNPGTSIYQYELIRELGSAGMGSVYLARDTRLGRRVAIKFLQQSARSLSKRFLLEAQATSRCSHENIVVIHEIGEYHGHPYMVLEYLEGQTLRQWLREHAATASSSGQPVGMPPGHAVALMLPVVRALVYAQLGDDGCPFAGLAAFQEGDADRFFGRLGGQAAQRADRGRERPFRRGQVGAGKSALVRAGVIPALKRSGEGWDAVILRPGRQPLGALAEVLLALPVRSSDIPTGRGFKRGADQVPAERDDIIARLRTEPGYLGIALRIWARAKLRRLVLFVDQFEELYTLGASHEERSCVIACLGSVADDVTSPFARHPVDALGLPRPADRESRVPRYGEPGPDLPAPARA